MTKTTIPTEIQIWADSAEGRAAIEKWLASPAGDEFRRRQASTTRKLAGPEGMAWLRYSPAGIAQRKAQLDSLGDDKRGITRRDLKETADKVLDAIEAARAAK